MKPVLFLTGHAPAYRVGAFARLHALEEVEFAFFGGAARHGGAPFEGELPFPHRHVSPREIASLAAGGRYRAVVCPTGGRLAPLAGWTGARRARVPLIVWASLWAHPRSLAHALTYLPLRRLYRSADAVVTYGPHVSAYVRARGARNVYVAPQSVDNDFWGARETQEPRAPGWHGQEGVRFLFAGRAAREKGLQTLLAAWRATGLCPPTASLVLAGPGSLPPPVPAGSGGQMDGVSSLDPLPPLELRRLYASAGALIVPSIATRTFREPWGLVVNEAMCRSLPVIASDEVGAVAGGLVRDGHNGLVFPAGDSAALAGAISRLAGDDALRAALGAQGARDVAAYTHEAWAEGFSRALFSLEISRGRW